MVTILSQYFSNQNFSYSGSNSFPQPLSSEDEEKYLTLYKEGDENAKNILVEHNLRLVAHIAKKYLTACKDSEDLISIGTIGLIKGVSSFNPEKNTKLATYSARCIENEILMHLRSSKKYANDMYLQDPISRDKEGNEITILDIISETEDLVSDIAELSFDIETLVKALKGELTKRELIVLKMRYGLFGTEEITQREVAKFLGISRSYVSRIEKKAISKLREKMCIAEF